jgi:MYXO-CTERM domain-containing protein
MYLCGTGSGSSGSGSSGSGDIGMTGSPVDPPWASPETGAGIGGAGGAVVVVPGAGGAGGASVTVPVAASGGIGGLAAGGTGGATILASDPAVGAGTGGTTEAFSSAPTSTGPDIGTPTAGLSKGGGCQLGPGGSGSGLGILLGLAYLLVRRRRRG